MWKQYKPETYRDFRIDFTDNSNYSNVVVGEISKEGRGFGNVWGSTKSHAFDQAKRYIDRYGYQSHDTRKKTSEADKAKWHGEGTPPEYKSWEPQNRKQRKGKFW